MHLQHEWQDLFEKARPPGKSPVRLSGLIRDLHQHDETMQFTVLGRFPKMRILRAGNLSHPHAEEA